jgi:subtilisin family serine protease
MYAPFPANLAYDRSFPYAKAGGTSVAAPLVAGVCAILFGRGGNHPTFGVPYKDLTCVQILSILMGSIGGGSGLKPEEFGAGFLQVKGIC